MSKDSHTPRYGGLGLAIVIGIAFLLFCSLRVIGDSSNTLSSQRALRSVLTESIWHTQLARNIAAFAIAHLFLTSLLGVCCWALACAAQIAWPAAKQTRNTWLLLWFILAASWILIGNAALYPWSLLGEPYAEIVTNEWYGVSLFSAATALSMSAVAGTLLRAIWVRFTDARAMIRRSPSIAVSITLVALVGIVGTSASGRGGTVSSRHPDRPNVVILGIDSLRWDVPSGALGKGLTPNIDEFLKHSVTFSDAITPLARTFPSWVATLTGRHPHTTGAIVNLLPRELIHTGDTLPEMLRRSGYRTVYAIDEVRFSNLDSTYGFDQMIAPPIGASDFLLGALNDAPLSNLIINTRLGQWLFPYSYGNRAAPITYDPDTFVDWFGRELPNDKPVFVAAHLTLAHWPYYWATAPERELQSAVSLQQLYTTALKRVDRQFSGLLAALQRRGILDDAIVILMSDHGEAIGLKHDNPYENVGQLDGLSPAGHGTSVLSPQQYRVVLGLRSFGNERVLARTAGAIQTPVSLIDLTPTVMDLLQISTTDSVDGQSLVPLIRGDADAAAQFADRIRFTETEFNPRGFQPGRTLTQSTLDAITSYYRLDAQTDRILIKADRVKALINERQYAAILHDQLLAAVPGTAGSNFRLIATHRNGGLPVELACVKFDPSPEMSALKSAIFEQFTNVSVGQFD